jgi:spore coat protein A
MTMTMTEFDEVESAKVLVRFGDYPGRYVFHCHNLEHEDMTMMADFVVT